MKTITRFFIALAAVIFYSASTAVNLCAQEDSAPSPTGEITACTVIPRYQDKIKHHLGIYFMPELCNFIGQHNGVIYAGSLPLNASIHPAGGVAIGGLYQLDVRQWWMRIGFGYSLYHLSATLLGYPSLKAHLGIHYISVPFRTGGNFLNHPRFSLGIGGGFNFDFGQTLFSNLFENGKRIDSEKSDVATLCRIAAVFTMNLQFRINDVVSLYVLPEISLAALGGAFGWDIPWTTYNMEVTEVMSNVGIKFQANFRIK